MSAGGGGEIKDQPPINNNEAFNHGEHCSRSDCGSLDFLPLRCQHCSLLFCGPHAPAQYHDCNSFDDRKIESSNKIHQNRSSSSNPNPDPVHELIKSHKDSNPQNDRSKDLIKNSNNSKARMILETKFPTSKRREDGRSQGTATKKKELSPAIKLILIKQKAISGDPRKRDGDVSLNDRWFGNLNCNLNFKLEDHLSSSPSQRRSIIDDIEDGGEVLKPKPVWFNKKTVVGKVFDLVQENFKSQIVTFRSSQGSTENQEFRMVVIRNANVKDLTEDCSKVWEEVVDNGEDVWLVCRS